MAQIEPSGLQTYAFRLAPGQDVKESIMLFAKQKKIKAGCILSAVGSLTQFNIRFANLEKGTIAKGHFEIVSLTGTFSDSSSHLHISVSDSIGYTTGGHLLNGNLVYTTLEVVVGELTEYEFLRELDKVSGYNELAVKKSSKKKK